MDAKSLPRVSILAYDGVNLFELGAALEIFTLSNALQPCYEVLVCAAREGGRIMAGPVRLEVEAGPSALLDAHTVIVPGWLDIDGPLPRAAIHVIQGASARGARIASICSGVFLLAEAGIMDGRRAAVHWSQARLLAERFPRIQVDSRVLYVDDGDVLSSAGRAAGLDLCLHIIRKDQGGKVARAVAQRMVIPAHRDGDQSQYIPASAQTQVDGLADLCAWMGRNLQRKISVDDMAARALMSRRTFIRRFEATTGTAPAEWLIQQRLARARELLEETIMPLDHIAFIVGFGTIDSFRHHFQRQFHTSPAAYRRRFRSGTDA
ncbi:helix-turn-helix domain-containing protein [Rhizobium lemnae]|uniref:Helix-turn-helix domain-containing protein n=1 Tax=Rhizobium lemnae TaxID=1214924 RepID=A0ABV8E7R3_9HYPH|nr:helix-turn-helix domain-containing protein [Rhizobium lemnae]MCJ8509303.1 helix-turn-helix domain-containing protein [Rhizobium lemnae]